MAPIAVAVVLMVLSILRLPERSAVHSSRPSFAYCQNQVHLLPQTSALSTFGQLRTSPPPMALTLVFCWLAF